MGASSSLCGRLTTSRVRLTSSIAIAHVVDRHSVSCLFVLSLDVDSGCRPVVLADAPRATLRAKQLRYAGWRDCGGAHPNAALICYDGRVCRNSHPVANIADFIPNDVELGGDGGHVMVLTGPNMGGKSTLLRQVRRRGRIDPSFAAFRADRRLVSRHTDARRAWPSSWHSSAPTSQPPPWS